MLLRSFNFVIRSRLLLPRTVLATYSAYCPTKTITQKDAMPPGSGSSVSKVPGPKRALYSGKVRFGFIPDEWFQFFHSKTGVTGPYLFMLVLANYMISKEIFIMEHEYYLGLSILIVISGAVKYLGPDLASGLDKEVDAVQAEFDKCRKDEIDAYENAIKSAKDSQWRAEGQQLLMDAKKENIAMQLESVYRERYMLVYTTVKGRMDYHVKRYNAEARIQQKWMIDWILENVKKSITPEFEKQALNAAIQELALVASRTN
ncbi:unnamed protein product [Chilo suppressalis]|uniref:ATP synthase subunit b n=1 Tax=Chilo suppressalis TaxID=168631 RepID=A0ABN8B4V0_CHISP|nr:unnamed protein product [Chilo suppressalis]